MFSIHPVTLVHGHIVIDDDQHVIIDTGSPLSFHTSGVLNLGGEMIPVASSVPGISKKYLSEKVGINIEGIIGMDFISKHSLLFCLKDGKVSFDDDVRDIRSFQNIKLDPLLGNLAGIRVKVNGLPANVVVDTGAPISYIHPSFTKGLKRNGTKQDFSPYVGDFQTDVYICEVDTMTGEKAYRQEFGNPPGILAATLERCNVDGIIGVDLFKRYNIQMRGTELFLS